MAIKKFTFEDWWNVKVVLNSTKGIPNEVSDDLVVSLDDFDNEEVIKIQNKQKVIFNELLQKKYNDLINEFQTKIQNSKARRTLINQEYKSLRALISNKFINRDDSYISPIKNDSKSFKVWYYKAMMNHKNNSIVSGIVKDFSEIPSTNSRFYDNGQIPPEVMISAIIKMFSFIQDNRKIKTSLEKTQTDASKIEEPNKSSTESNEQVEELKMDLVKESRVNPYPDIFSSIEAYDFFCELESLTVEKSEYVAGYSFIYHKMKNKTLNFPIKKRVTQKDFCDFLCEERGQEEICPPKLPVRVPKRKEPTYNICLTNYLKALNLNCE
jgi:hypothetical protein